MSLPGPGRTNRRISRALQGVLLALCAPVGWLALNAVAGRAPAAVLAEDTGILAYMLVGTMTAFGLFGWRLGREEERLRLLAMQDELTGLANNRLFGQRLSECLAQGARNATPQSLLLIDMDHFKSINDTYGHQAGDVALKTAASVIRSSVRASDVTARIGGEEFAVILPDTPVEEARNAAERILAGLRSASVRLSGGGVIELSASIGLAGGVPAGGESPYALIAQADKALYKAKDDGRGRLAAA